MQDFQGAALYWSPATADHAVLRGPLAAAWGSTGWEWGTLGYPDSEQTCGLADGGCTQTFQRGDVVSSTAAGGHAVSGGILIGWNSLGREQGSLGYPTGDQRCGLIGSGCLQYFQHGVEYWSPTGGPHAVLPGPIADAWAATGWEWGTLGYPVGEQTCGLTDGGCAQAFTKGSLYSSTSSGAHAVSGGILAGWTGQGRETGSLGYPTSDQRCGLTASGCLQYFQHGVEYWSPTGGPHAIRPGPIADAWGATGWEWGTLGYPVGDVTTTADGTSQAFQRGTIKVTTDGRVQIV
jgi:uncharacterized protein with LGFP repeats